MEETHTEEIKEEANKTISFLSDKSNFLGMSILISALVVSGTLIYVFGSGGNSGALAPTVLPTENGDLAVPSDSPEIGDAPMLGNPNALVTIVEYSDYECPFCGRFFEESLAMVKSEYVDTGKVNFVYKDFPLTSIHFQAQKAAEAARCVRDQLDDDGYWKMHDTIFERQQLLSIANYKEWARELGANGAEFDGCLDTDKYASAVTDDLNEGAALGVTGTPTFFINDMRVVGAVPFEQIAAVIEAELAKAN